MNIPRQDCSKCGNRIDATTGVYDQQKPRLGDISICLYCGHPTIFINNYMRRDPTPEEALTISLMPDVMELQLAQANMPKRK